MHRRVFQAFESMHSTEVWNKAKADALTKELLKPIRETGPIAWDPNSDAEDEVFAAYCNESLVLSSPCQRLFQFVEEDPTSCSVRCWSRLIVHRNIVSEIYDCPESVDICVEESRKFIVIAECLAQRGMLLRLAHYIPYPVRNWIHFSFATTSTWLTTVRGVAQIASAITMLMYVRSRRRPCDEASRPAIQADMLRGLKMLEELAPSCVRSFIPSCVPGCETEQVIKK